MKIIKLDVLAVDTGDIGEDAIKALIQNSCPELSQLLVKKIEIIDVPFDSEHPLLDEKTHDETYAKMFPEPGQGLNDLANAITDLEKKIAFLSGSISDKLGKAEKLQDKIRLVLNKNKRQL